MTSTLGIRSRSNGPARRACKPDRDHVVIPGVRADRSEPLEQGGTITKLGIDATRRRGDRPTGTCARPPAAAMREAANCFANHKLV